MKLLRNKLTGQYRVLGYAGTTAYFPSRELAVADYRRLERNYYHRERNQVLRDLTGTSAAAAKRDMGL